MSWACFLIIFFVEITEQGSLSHKCLSFQEYDFVLQLIIIHVVASIPIKLLQYCLRFRLLCERLVFIEFVEMVLGLRPQVSICDFRKVLLTFLDAF